MEKCSMCESNEVVYKKRTSSIKEDNFCSNCFAEYIEHKVFSFIEEYNLIEDGDIIGVGASGGKDSQFLIHLLLKYRNKRDFQIKCLLVDEGIKNYREIGIDIINKYAQANKMQLFVSTMKSEYGYEVDEFVNIYKEKYNKSFRVCSICDPTRINIVKKMAVRESCNKMALGINLDDHIITFFVSMQSSNMAYRLLNVKPQYKTSGIEYIYPLSLVSDKEISLYNILEKIPYQIEPSCPYADTCLDGRYRNIIYELEDMIPGYRLKAWNNIQILNDKIVINKEAWGECEICGGSIQEAESKICVDCDRYNKLRAKAGI